jgi:hypothetical protein
MRVQEAFEEYLLEQMALLCRTSGGAPGGVSDASRMIDALGLFDVVTPFERIESTLGRGIVAPPRVVEDAPESMRVSVEHRYALSPWPSFEFTILESEGGIAWGQAFARKTGTSIPRIDCLSDLRRWSHVESEVRAALGAPESHEGWSPWKSAIYRVDGAAFTLCYVYELLQSVRPEGLV